MEEINPDDARGGHPSRKHKVLKVLVISLVLVAVAWFVVELLYGRI